jgi:hypothetical protein
MHPESLAVFLSAFLLFQIQAILGHVILPWFGGAPAVWSACLMFFQLLLLAAYLYSHLLAVRWPPRRQARVHLALLSVSLLWLGSSAFYWGSSLLPPDTWKPADSNHPILHILVILLASAGVPYFVLATTGPLLQAWFGHLRKGQPPYKLYALSNAGSIGGIISYPVAVEPWLALKTQASLWAIAYLAFAISCGLLAFRLRRVKPPCVDSNRTSEERNGMGEAPAPGFALRLLWIVLAACPAVLLLAVTNQMCQEVAVIPFLWVWPLALYLLTLVICFTGERFYRRLWGMGGLAPATAFLCWVLFQGPAFDLKLQLAAHSLLLFMACMVCHGELFRARPAPRHLTSFYLMAAFGGALGGVFVNLAAPFLFSGYWEFHLGVFGVWVLVLLILVSDKQSFLHREGLSAPSYLLLGSGVGMLGAFLALQASATERGVCEVSRTFYGVLRVIGTEEPDHAKRAYILSHGATRHGYQFAEPGRRREPTGYHRSESGIGLALGNLPGRSSQTEEPRPLKVGVAGLGVATLAAYGRAGDLFRFYELSPDVIRLARGEGGWFTYLRDTPAKVEIVPGDARLSLETDLQESGSQQFDVLVLDAFSSDSVPVHLLTREAFALYLEHLKSDGILAVDITNHHLDLRPVIQGQAGSFGLKAGVITTPPDENGAWGCTWMLLSRDEEFFRLPPIAARLENPEKAGKPVQLWTDDFSNLFQILR